MVHHNINQENILVEDVDNNGDCYVKITNFGSLNDPGKVKKNSYFLSPEAVLEKETNEKVDMWACGVLLYLMIIGSWPFDGINDGDIFCKIKTGKFPKDKNQWEDASPEVKKLISGLLDMDVSDRISASEALDHKWFKKMKTKETFTQVDKRAIQHYMKNIKNYKNYSKIQQAVLAFIVHNMEPNTDIRTAQKIYRIFGRET
jgi:serine/threonine protein kinase